MLDIIKFLVMFLAIVGSTVFLVVLPYIIVYLATREQDRQLRQIQEDMQKAIERIRNA